jgi:hypothetical protein
MNTPILSISIYIYIFKINICVKPTYLPPSILTFYFKNSCRCWFLNCFHSKNLENPVPHPLQRKKMGFFNAHDWGNQTLGIQYSNSIDGPNLFHPVTKNSIALGITTWKQTKLLNFATLYTLPFAPSSLLHVTDLYRHNLLNKWSFHKSIFHKTLNPKVIFFIKTPNLHSLQHNPSNYISLMFCVWKKENQ